MVVLFYISCIVFSTKCYIMCMYTLQMIFQCSKVAYSIFVKLCHPSNGFVSIKFAYFDICFHSYAPSLATGFLMHSILL